MLGVRALAHAMAPARARGVRRGAPDDGHLLPAARRPREHLRRIPDAQLAREVGRWRGGWGTDKVARLPAHFGLSQVALKLDADLAASGRVV